jgi:hypothetical protein
MNKQAIISRANAIGSAATTVKGAVKWLVKHHKPVKPMVLPGDQEWVGIVNQKVGWYYHKGVRVRRALSSLLSDEERFVRRAKNDPKFRRKFIKRLESEENSIFKLHFTLDGIEKADANQDQWNRRLIEISNIFSSLNRRRRTDRTIHLGSIDRICVVPVSDSEGRKCGAEINMRGKFAKLIPCIKQSYRIYVPPESIWRNGKPVGYTNCLNRNYVQSFAVLSENPGPTVDYRLHGKDYRITMPAGYCWNKDMNGLRVVHGADDYHPTVSDLIAKDSAERIVRMLSERARVRRETMAKLAAECAESDGVYVCVADSIKAGNCRTGTVQWAINHKLDINRHYAPVDLLEHANGDIGRVRLAIKAATIRHRMECDRGYADIKDHQVKE